MTGLDSMIYHQNIEKRKCWVKMIRKMQVRPTDRSMSPLPKDGQERAGQLQRKRSVGWADTGLDSRDTGEGYGRHQES